MLIKIGPIKVLQHIAILFYNIITWKECYRLICNIITCKKMYSFK